MGRYEHYIYILFYISICFILIIGRFDTGIYIYVCIYVYICKYDYYSDNKTNVMFSTNQQDINKEVLVSWIALYQPTAVFRK